MGRRLLCAALNRDVDRVPTDVWRAVFACDVLNVRPVHHQRESVDLDTRVNLTHVCGEWRAILVGWPEWWSVISWGEGGMGVVETVQCLARSGSRGLQLLWRMIDVLEDVAEVQVPWMMTLFSTLASRWESVDLCYAGEVEVMGQGFEMWESRWNASFPSLKRARFDVRGLDVRPWGRMVIEAAPNLQGLELELGDDDAGPELEHVWRHVPSSLTSLDVGSLPLRLRDVLDLLQCLPSLAGLKVLLGYVDNDPLADPGRLQMQPHRSLARLHISNIGNESVDWFFRVGNLPNLRYINFPRGSDELTDDHFAGFIERSGCRLRGMTYENIGEGDLEDFLEKVLGQRERMAKLKVWQYAGGTTEPLAAVLSWLEDGENLPALRRMTLRLQKSRGAVDHEIMRRVSLGRMGGGAEGGPALCRFIMEFWQVGEDGGDNAGVGDVGAVGQVGNVGEVGVVEGGVGFVEEVVGDTEEQRYGGEGEVEQYDDEGEREEYDDESEGGGYGDEDED